MSTAQAKPSAPKPTKKAIKAARAKGRSHFDFQVHMHEASERETANQRAERATRLERWWRRDPLIVQNEEQLLTLFKARDLDQMMVRLSKMFYPWIATYDMDVVWDSGETVPFVGVGWSASPLEYPLNVGQLLASMAESANLGDHISAWDTLDRTIGSVEGFKVQTHSQIVDIDENPHVKFYPYTRKAPEDWTVRQWIDARFDRHYPGWGVTVLTTSPDDVDSQLFKAASPRMKLKTLRSQWGGEQES